MYEISARKIRELLFEKGWNKSELARLLSVSPQTVHQWEKGITRPNGPNLTRLADVSGKPEHWFFQGDEEVSPEADDAPIHVDALSPEEERLIALYRQFHSIERTNMVEAFEMRLKELQAYYSKK